MIIDCAHYQDGRRCDEGAVPLEEAAARCKQGGFVWLGLFEPKQDELDQVRETFGLHELAVEDAITAHQRPKLEIYDDLVFMVLKTAHYQEERESVETGEIQVFVGEGFVITVRHDETPLHEVREELERRPDLLRLGPGAVLHGIVDRVVDDYFPVIQALDQDIQEVETDVFSPARTNPAERIYKLKREILELHEAVSPLEDPVDRLAEGGTRCINDELKPYFRDVADHVVKAERATEGFRDMLTSVLAANLTQISVRQNDDVRKISAWAAIIAVPTLITGVYGMNFDHMPELGWRFGYPLTLAAMACVCFLLYRYFKRAGWL